MPLFLIILYGIGYTLLGIGIGVLAILLLAAMIFAFAKWPYLMGGTAVFGFILLVGHDASQDARRRLRWKRLEEECRKRDAGRF